MPTPAELLQTKTLLGAIEQTEPVPHFFKDWFFNQTIVFGTPKVLMEYKDGSRIAAPFIAPRVNGISINRDGSELREYEPFITGATRVLTLDRLEQRGFGEALYSNLTPEQRQRALIIEDMQYLTDVISVREEAMCASAIFNNGIIANELINDFDKALPQKDIYFYSEEVNPGLFTISQDWDTTEASGKQIFDELAVMVRKLRKRGLPANIVITGPEVMDVLLKNEYLIKLADNRQLTNTLNMIPQELPDGVVHYLDLNVHGRILSFYSYDETYFEQEFDEKGVPQVEADGQPKMIEKSFVPYGTIALGARDAGKLAYGSISQKEKYIDDQIHTYTGRLVPRYLSPETSDDRSISLRSKCIPIPFNKAPFMVAKVIVND